MLETGMRHPEYSRALTQTSALIVHLVASLMQKLVTQCVLHIFLVHSYSEKHVYALEHLTGVVTPAWFALAGGLW
jgi:hypothetical protein